MSKLPDTIGFLFCPVCGRRWERTDWVRWHKGRIANRCSGTPEPVMFQRVISSKCIGTFNASSGNCSACAATDYDRRGLRHE